MVNNNCAATIDGVIENLDPQEVKASFDAKKLTEISEMQFFAQQTWGGWAVADPGDIMYVGTVSMIASDNIASGTVVFDPADYEGVEGVTVEEIGGAKYVKFVADGTWDGVSLELLKPYKDANYNKVKTIMIVKKGTATFEASTINGSVQFIANGAGAGFFTGVEVSENGVEAIGDYDGSLLESLQIFSQSSAQADPIAGTEIWIGKVEAYYEEPQPADETKVAKIQYINAATFEADGLTKEEFWSDILENSELESEDGNLINRIAVDDEKVFEIEKAETHEVKVNANSYGYWFAGWDLEKLYIWVDIKDDKADKLPALYNLEGDDIETLDGASAQTWMNDCVELFLDFNNQRIKKMQRGAQQYQIRFNYGIQGPAYGTTNGVMLNSQVFGEGSSDTTNIDFATTNQADGWILEASIPWATLMMKNGITKEAVADSLKTNPTGADKAYETAEFWGEIELTGSGIQGPTAVNETAAASLNVYPNPANDVLYVGLEDVVAVNIYNVAGSLVKAANEAVVNIADLNAGIYVVKATDAAGNTSIAKFVKK